eukprot:4175123-Prorocentrum_lima.AAC.1
MLLSESSTAFSFAPHVLSLTCQCAVSDMRFSATAISLQLHGSSVLNSKSPGQSFCSLPSLVRRPVQP